MSQLPLPDPNLPDPDSVDQPDQETVRAILRAAPILAVPRDFTLDPAIHGRSRLRVGRVIGFPTAWPGLAAVAAILVVVLAVSFASQKNQAGPVSSININNAIALQPTNQPTALTLNAAARSTIAPSITIIVPDSSTAAKAAQNQDSISGLPTQTAQLIPNTVTEQSAGANGNTPQLHTPQLQTAPLSGAASGAFAPQAQSGQAPTSIPAQPTVTQLPGISANNFAEPRDLQSQFVAIVRALLYWLRLIPAP